MNSNAGSDPKLSDAPRNDSPKSREKNGSLMNAVQRKIVDRYFLATDVLYSGLVFTTGKVTLYIFKDEWIEMDIEGPLYLYKREDKKFRHTLVVLNRKDTQDMRVDVPESFHVEYQQQQFVIFGYLDKTNIFGFWFDSSQVAKNFYDVMKGLPAD